MTSTKTKSNILIKPKKVSEVKSLVKLDLDLWFIDDLSLLYAVLNVQGLYYEASYDPDLFRRKSIKHSNINIDLRNFINM